jgi:hypothetical protein
MSRTGTQVQKNEADRIKQLEKWATKREKAGKLETDIAVINPRRPLEEPPVLMDPGLAAKLKPHQVRYTRTFKTHTEPRTRRDRSPRRTTSLH